MIIKKIQLINFRNFNKEKISFSKNNNIIIGDNAQGKTNIIESIYFLAITKSYRTNEINLINCNNNFCKIKGSLIDDKIPKELSIEIVDNIKKVKINNNEIKKISDYISNLNVILVSPEDINILQGAPADRRNFLNIELSQLYRKYIKNYNEFNKILKIRNNYLKSLQTGKKMDSLYFESILENLIERQIYIYQERNNFINLLNNEISEIYYKITGRNNLSIKYETNIEIDNFDYDNLKNILVNKYNKNIKKEIENGTTLYGPHRDDFKFLLNESDIKLYGSQGQQKAAIIALKLAEINIFRKITGKNPIILLDDIFSELDIKVRNKLIKFFPEDIQIIVTTTDLKGINKKFIDSAKIFKVTDGKIMEKGEK